MCCAAQACNRAARWQRARGGPGGLGLAEPQKHLSLEHAMRVPRRALGARAARWQCVRVAGLVGSGKQNPNEAVSRPAMRVPRRASRRLRGWMATRAWGSWWAWQAEPENLSLRHATQGKSAFARLGGNARAVGLMGMGQQNPKEPVFGHAAQGKSAFARLGGNARVVGLVGMGKQEKATPVTEWGPSAFQARRLTRRLRVMAA